ncbi:hypothetical protein [Kitasatospora sp. NPDC057541]|uniref:hypothetical protein n=1 Tax=unclassified Kitasatospora TaxID=2633591 RepID=UPI0036A09C0F
MNDREFEARYEDRFAKWLERMDSAPAVLPADGSTDWIRRVYREHGELPAERFGWLAFDHKCRTVTQALRQVVADVRESTHHDLDILPEFTNPSPGFPAGDVAVAGMAIQSFDGPRVWAEVADAVQSYLADRYRTVWPLCPRHRVGLHAVTHDGGAIWWCNVGEHPGDRIPAGGPAAA